MKERAKEKEKSRGMAGREGKGKKGKENGKAQQLTFEYGMPSGQKHECAHQRE